MTSRRWVASAILLAVAGCAAPSAPPPAATAPAPAPAADAARALLAEGETLQTLDLGSTGRQTVTGEIRGTRTTIYAVTLQPGQTLEVQLQSSSRIPRFNVYDAAQPQGAALHRGDTQGRTARLTARTATTFVIRPQSPANVARRGAIFPYTLAVARQ